MRSNARMVEGEVNATKQVLDGNHLIVHGSDNIIYGDDNEARGDGNTLIGDRVKGTGNGIQIRGTGVIQGTGTINGTNHEEPTSRGRRHQRHQRHQMRTTHRRFQEDELPDGFVQFILGTAAGLIDHEEESERPTRRLKPHGLINDIPCPDESEESKDAIAKEGEKPCEICCENVVRCISVPCGHASMCITCSRKWLKSTTKNHLACTQCRDPVDRINLFYL